MSEPTPEPSRRGRLGFSRLTLSLVGLAILLAFLAWVFLP